jgi:hypothetical protein
MRIRLVKPEQQHQEEDSRQEVPEEADESRITLAIQSWVKEFRLRKKVSGRASLLPEQK